MQNIIFFVLFFCFSNLLFAQDTQKEQIDKTIRGYFEGYMNGNLEKLAVAFDTTSGHLYANKVENSKSTIMPHKFGNVVKRWAKNAQTKPYSEAEIKQSYYKILFLDITDDKAAVAKIEIKLGQNLFVDYLSLYKSNENWKIVGKTYVQK